MRGMAAIPFVLGLVGCVASLSYREPDSGPRARVRFVPSTDMVTTVWRYADEECSGGEQGVMRLRNGSPLDATPKRLGMPLWTGRIS